MPIMKFPIFHLFCSSGLFLNTEATSKILRGHVERRTAPLELEFQTKPCLMFLSHTEEASDNDRIAWYCQVFGEDAERAGEVDGHSAYLKIEGLDSAFGLKSGVTTLFAEEAIISPDSLVIPNGARVIFDTKEMKGRKLSVDTVDVTKSALVVRVKAPTIETTSPIEELVSNVFGDDGDQYNLKSQMEGCSYGRVKIEKATGDNISDGATLVTITEESEDRGEMQRFVLRELENIFETDDLKTVADLILICMPRFSGDWSAYAYFNSPLSFYNDDRCNYPSLQLHEVGHNFNLGHSSQAVLEYGDRSGTMGGSIFVDEGEGSLRCYNAAKNWQLGWFGENSIDLDLVEQDWKGRLIAPANFQDSMESQKIVVLKIVDNYYIQFNYAKGFNAGSSEFINRVTVVRQAGDGHNSWVYAALREGESFVIDDVYNLEPITIQVLKIDTTNDQEAFADVEVYRGEQARCVETCCFEINCGTDSNISVDKDSYQPGEQISVSFSYNTPKSLDWIWIVDEASVDEFGEISKRWNSGVLWLYTCGSKDCDDPTNSGNLNFDSSKLQAGRYVAYYLLKDGYEVAVASSPFTVIEDGNTLSPTEAPSLAIPYVSTVTTNDSSFSLGEVIQVSFVDPNPTHVNWVAIYSTEEQVSDYGRLSSNYLLWQYTCGSKNADDCDEVTTFEGSVDFNSEDLDAGTYRAYLLFGDYESVIDSSDEFTVGLASPTDASTASPSESPSEFRTNAPSKSPTESPSDIPSESPTAVPVTQPPSKFPSDSPSKAPTESPTATPSSTITPEPTCRNIPGFKFIFGKKNKLRNCKWVGKKKQKRCKKKYNGKRLDFYCPDSCDLC